MAITSLAPIAPEIEDEMLDAVAIASQRTRTPAIARAACERMDRIRNANREESGEADIGVEIIREFRDVK